MRAMVQQAVIPYVIAHLERTPSQCRQSLTRIVFHTWGVPEADVDARLKGLVPTRMPVALGLLASPIGVLVSLTTKGESRLKEGALSSLAEEVRGRLGEWVYAEGYDTMEQVVGRLLRQQSRTVAVAESCTGGLIGQRLTQVPGSSAYVDRVAVCYSNRAKIEMLGVAETLLNEHGAVSREVAAAMAKGMRERAGVSVALSVTGIAGPGGATETKPIGLVYIGLDGGSDDVMTKECRFHGDRSVIQQRAAQAALDMLRRWLVSKGTT
ncbi:MAG: nicotinamide-nucleotide amidohydrolase family protein [Nitrospira sp.]|nr:nicotinamide-nucleotide amidohydrolase family protein [Nitrospira sp.]